MIWNVLQRLHGTSRNYSEQIATDIDEEIKDIVEKCYIDCTNILTEHMDKLHAVAEELLRKEKLDDEEFKAIMEEEKNEPQQDVQEEPEVTVEEVY